MLFTYDIGHGKHTAGKRSPAGEREWYFNKTYSDAFVKQLQLYQNVTIKCVSDYSGETDTSLSARTNRANTYGSHCHISFHCNANTANWGTWGGVETHVYKKCTNTSEAYKLAKVVQKALVESSGLRDRGVKKTDLHITRETNMTAILIENGFMDSTTDIVVLRNKTKMETIGRAIADAVANFYCLKRKIEVKPNAVSKLNISHMGVATCKCDVALYSEAGNTDSYVKHLAKGSYLAYCISNNMINLGGKQWILHPNKANGLIEFKHLVLTNTKDVIKYNDKDVAIGTLAKGAWIIWMMDTVKNRINLGGCWVYYDNTCMTIK